MKLLGLKNLDCSISKTLCRIIFEGVLIKSKIYLLLLFVFYTSCGKNLTFRIGDQDYFALIAQDSCNFLTNSMGIRVSWKSAPPIYFRITPSVPAKFDSAIISAAKKWNNSYRTLVYVSRENEFTRQPGDDGANAIYWMNDWSDSSPNEQARTSVNWNISKITDTDIKINAKNFSYYIDADDNTAGKVHLESLLVHEFGHALGLSHITSPGSVMQPTLSAQTVRSIPSPLDIDSLNCEY